jgi:hypothetical protein
MSSAQSVVHRDCSGRRAVGNDRRSFLVEPDTTCLVPLRQRIKTDLLDSSSYPLTSAPSRTANALLFRSFIILT